MRVAAKTKTWCRQGRKRGPSAADFLKALLANGPMLVGKVEEQARQRGFSKDQLDRAKRKLEIISEKGGFNGRIQWGLDLGAARHPGRLPNLKRPTIFGRGLRGLGPFIGV
jgi:hypothetical protein